MTTHSSRKDLLKLPKEELLRLSVEDRLAAFHEVRLKHPRVNQALAEISLMAKAGSGSNITLLVGPTGVGKSTLVDALRKQVLDENRDRMHEDLSMIPIIVSEAPASGERGFSWRILYQRLGDELNEPLMMKKQETHTEDGRVTVRPVSTKATVAALRTAVEKAMVYRNTSIVVIDEAVHLLRNTHGNTLENHMDAVKSLANICGVNIILVGSYDLMPLLKLSAQVARRTSVVHFPRYLTGEELDERAFSMVLMKLTEQFPLEEKVDLSRYAKRLQVSCVGCVGILKNTLSRALALALNDKGKWDDSYVERALMPPLQHRAILEETIKGEREMLTSVLGSGSFKEAEKQYQEVELMVLGAS